VLLVTGAYFPEISAAAVQCRAVAAALRERVTFGVLTTAVDLSLPATGTVDDVPVHRIGIDVRSRWSTASAAIRTLARLRGILAGYDIVHLHGFSKKNVLVTWAARLAGKRVVLTLHTAGQDEPDIVRRAGRAAYRSFMTADAVLAVSPHLRDAYARAADGRVRVELAPNGIDTQRFRPVSAEERTTLRRRLHLPIDRPIVLFVGFFSRDKRPDLLFRAWRRATAERGLDAALVLIGATQPDYYEVDHGLAGGIRAAASAAGLMDRVHFVPPTNEIAAYFQAADLFVLPSAREANPLALLEAMASGLPCIASRLPGATDVIIEDGVDGRLFPVDDEAALAAILGELLTRPAEASALGARARETVTVRFGIARAAEAWLAAYRAATATL
jgi:glycosyltransferase involved in cell wall biosynthesis